VVQQLIRSSTVLAAGMLFGGHVRKAISRFESVICLLIIGYRIPVVFYDITLFLRV
jgi:hypothetical protein